MTLFGYICMMDNAKLVTYTITQVKNDYNKYAVTNDKSGSVLVYDSLVEAIEETGKLCSN